MALTRRFVTAALATAPLGLFAQQRESDWPRRPVTIIVGFPSGQTTDVVARTLAAHLGNTFGQPFIVDNRPGAGSTIAAAAVARAKPDSYTILMGASGNLAVAPHLYANLAYDPLKDFDHVAMTGVAPLVLLVRSDYKYKTLTSLIQAAKGGATINYASGGTGVVNHLAMELLKKATGARMTHIPYRGSGPALTDLLGGQVDCMFETLPPTLPLIRSGKLLPLAVSSLKSVSILPDVPAVEDTYQGFGSCVPWTIVSVPAGTPETIVSKLAKEVFEVMKDPQIKAKFESLGSFFDPSMDQEKTKAWVFSEYAKFGKIIKDGNIKMDQ